MNEETIEEKAQTVLRSYLIRCHKTIQVYTFDLHLCGCVYRYLTRPLTLIVSRVFPNLYGNGKKHREYL
ncbi:MAG TPA: hypothetical protein VMW72_17460 [Sedimentisphaerales bacterium]|nr:hypothetical protein [Sedimentisphaerales bacterium]